MPYDESSQCVTEFGSKNPFKINTFFILNPLFIEKD